MVVFGRGSGSLGGTRRSTMVVGCCIFLLRDGRLLC
jgi:hypothetical protein